MTREHWKALLPVITAFAEGKEIEGLRGEKWGGWEDIIDLNFNDRFAHYRIKPTPKLRPWKEGEIPLGALWRVGSCETVYSPSWTDKSRVSINTANYHIDDLFKYWQHSLDNGKTWLPCGVMEDGQ